MRFPRATHLGTGLDVAIEYAKTCGAWQEPRDGLRPGPGAIVQVVRPMHVCVVVRWEDERTVITADGGQVGRRGLQACALRRRRWEKRPDGVYLGSRRVRGWIDVDLLGYRDELVAAPRGWESIEA